MADTPTLVPGDEATEEELPHQMHIRMGDALLDAIKSRARSTGLKPSQVARQELMKAFGLDRAPQSRRRRT